MEENEEDEDDDMYPGFLPEYGGTMGGQNEEPENEEPEGEEKASHEPDDELRRVIVDAQRGCESEREKLKFNRMLEDHKKGLYPNCEEGNTKLGATLKLLQWKAEHGIPGKGFGKALKIFKKQLPKEIRIS